MSYELYRIRILGGMFISLVVLIFSAWFINVGKNEEVAALTKTCNERVRGVEFDKAAADVKLKAAQAETKTTQAAWDQAVARLHADNTALLSELDADGDKVHIPTDVCPDTKFVEGFGHEILGNGCSNDQVVRAGCKSWKYPPDVKTGSAGKIDWFDCKLSPDPTLAYRCSWSVEFASYSEGCYNFDPNEKGG